MTKKNFSSRAIAAQLLVEVIQKQHSLTQVLTDPLFQKAKKQDRSFIQELCYGVLRWHEQLTSIIKELLKNPLKNADQDIQALLLLGLYQLLHLQTQSHAAIHATVEAARELNKSWAVSLINGVLRNWQRQSPDLLKKIEKNPSAHYSHPHWLLTKLKKDWPQHWKTIIQANNERPSLTLRVNHLQQTRENYLAQLLNAGIAAHATQYAPMGITLEKPQNITTLPGFSEGIFSVQDESAQLAAELLELAPGQQVLDACAAPGGKTAHILETEPALANLTIIDIDQKRLEKIQENLARLKLFNPKIAHLHTADAAQPNTWWNGKLYDRILLDAPCSATGVIRRHPDIKLLRRTTDIFSFAAQQKQLLEALWPLLKPGGLLVYATCSIFPEENWQLVKTFLSHTPNAEEKPFTVNWGMPVAIGRQLLPQLNSGDGFYYAILQKSVK